MATLIILGGSLQLLGTVLLYLFQDPARGNSLIATTPSYRPRRDAWWARVGLALMVVGFVLSMIAAIAAL